MHRILVATLCLLPFGAAAADTTSATPPATVPSTRPATLPASGERYVKAADLPAPGVNQAAAADERFAYAVHSTHVVKFDRADGREVARSTGPAKHLNSGFLWQGKLYCAHSNFPRKPDESDVRVLDPATMKLTVFHKFDDPPGSLTWVLRRGDAWWCHFAWYGKDNAKSLLISFDDQWRETGRWTYPPALVAQWGTYSLSGGVWDGDTLLTTGHDKRVLYRLRVPPEPGAAVEVVHTVPCPFTGQGIAADPKTGGLVGIDRGKGRVVFARREGR